MDTLEFCAIESFCSSSVQMQSSADIYGKHYSLRVLHSPVIYGSQVIGSSQITLNPIILSFDRGPPDPVIARLLHAGGNGSRHMVE